MDKAIKALTLALVIMFFMQVGQTFKGLSTVKSNVKIIVTK